MARYISNNSNSIESINKVENKVEKENDEVVDNRTTIIDAESTKSEITTNSTPIGRVVLSQRSWATPMYFPFWVMDNTEIHVEPGTIITVESDDDQNLMVVGIVEEIKAMSDVPDVMLEFYGWGYGNPTQNMSTHRPIIREAKARVVYRSDGRAEPIVRKYPVRFAEREMR